MWYHWFKIRIREYRLLEIFFFACLFMIFYRLQTISNQNDRILEMFNGKKTRLVSISKTGRIHKKVREDPTSRAVRWSAANETPNTRFYRKMEPSISKTNQTTSKTDNSTSNLPISDERFRFNAADYLLGAYVETHLSSRSSLYSINQWESNLVLLDRPQPPADKAWCSNDENPVLTIDLAKYIKPISVSYQHSQWNETIPKEAPKTYDVVACLDCNCKIWEPLALNCHYSEYEPNGSEQMCNISSYLDVRRTGKIQFRFRENYGGPNMTCVSLVRVYGETKTPVKMEKHLNSETTCADLKWNYHNSYIGYLLASSMERKLETLASQKLSKDIRKFDKIQPVEQSDEAQKTKLSTKVSTDKRTPTVSKINQLTSQTDDSTLKAPILEERFRLNAADFLLGASVDSEHSSSSNLNGNLGNDQADLVLLDRPQPPSDKPFPKERFRFNAADYLLGASVDTDLSSSSSLHSDAKWESNLVLLDRPQPPADKAWCTHNPNPVLTINLAQYIKPISVSYQHSKWNVFIPGVAPKRYDVVGCFDDDCKTWETLVLNCQYSEDESNEAEQICTISPNLDMPLIGKVQFRFRENYGHTRRTCVNLVRVYGETETPVKLDKKHLNSEKTCADLKWYYHNSYFRYYWSDKNCKVLYENECCSDCPECCQECLIYDYNIHTFFIIGLWILAIIGLVLLIRDSWCFRSL
ncbi:hypothetical protein B9Z55_015312 [Caenorhabditis nigoni]|uniref:SUN domain-containing protein n=1 Tax=Caenorhabditis nigoni TaxID=1611254 RepID=A0A2G5U9N9_9PELO|nr:hypothetical protein B9Z55_015312 [Caenorhabditis nigoni]